MPADGSQGFNPSASRPPPAPPGERASVLRFLVVGDIFGQPGRLGAARIIPALRQEGGIDCVIANGENAAGGRGLTAKTADELFSAGIDVLTLGNHTWSQREMLTVLTDEQIRIVRPLNYPPGVPGRGFVDIEVRGVQVRVVSLMGRVFLTESLDDPFRAADAVVRNTPDDAVVLVDIHGEATSEKVAM